MKEDTECVNNEDSSGREVYEDGDNNLCGNDNGLSKFPSETSSELTNQELTPNGSALSNDHDLQGPIFNTDEANSSSSFYPFGIDCPSNFIQDMHMASNYFNFPPLGMEDFPQINISGTAIFKPIDHQETIGYDKFKEYMKGSVMFEDIFNLCSTQVNSIPLPLDD